MKKLSFILLFIVWASQAFAQEAWTIATVPNTRLQGNDIHVSDPDGYLSDSVEMTINIALCAIRDTADVFLVTLRSIGEEEPKRFATLLFNRWGIGDAGKDNGVLLLFVEDQHALEFETGYGAEETLTDAVCERIFTKAILPCFRSGDYEGGLCAGVARIVEVYGGAVPMGLMTHMPASAGTDNASVDDDFDNISGIMAFVSLMILILPVVGLVYWAKKKSEKPKTADVYKLKTEDGVTYIEDAKTSWSGSPWEGKGCAGALMIGCSLFLFLVLAYGVISARFPSMSERNQFTWASVIAFVLYLTWICFRQGSRTLQTADQLAKLSLCPKEIYKKAFNHKSNKIAFWMAPWLGWVFYRKLKSRMEHSSECQCPTCQNQMKKDSNFKLSEIHALENRIGALKFEAYRCANGHTIVLKEKGKDYSKFSTCDFCGAFTLKKTYTVTLKEATYSHSGEKEETYECQNCGHTFSKKVVIPMKISYTSSSSGSSSGRSYSSHSSSGSFGGGRSGGGGYSGRW